MSSLFINYNHYPDFKKSWETENFKFKNDLLFFLFFFT